MERPDLYFIALIPGLELRDEISVMKEEMKRDFNSSHALKSPAHITLQMPFKANSQDELQLVKTLSLLAAGEKPFRVDLNGFGAFAPRVLFIRVSDHKQIEDLHLRLSQMLRGLQWFPQDEIMSDVHPHITIATRDLSKEMFKLAWPQFENREFDGTFETKSIFLLKHNGRNWDIFMEFTFGGNE